MSTENKELARRARLEMWKNPAIADEILAADFLLHAHDPITPRLPAGPENMKKIIKLYMSAFPDAEFTLDDLIAEGEKVVVRWTATGTHQAGLAGIPATGRRVTVSGTDVYRVSGGKLREAWTNWDTLGFVQQLGVVPRLE
jgi:steroid delta-isomerase-like uncharacterized protein